MHGYQYCNCTLIAKKTDMYISHFSSSEPDAITRKKEEECQTKQFGLSLLKEENVEFIIVCAYALAAHVFRDPREI